MTPRPAPETIDQLRAILLRLERAPDPAHDTAGLDDLERLLLVRIAELEAAETQAETTEASDAAASSRDVDYDYDC